MEMDKREISDQSVSMATYTKSHYMQRAIERAEKLRTDPEKDKRHEEAECPMCYYDKSRVGGAAITTIPCGLCGEELCFGNTCVDVVCTDCAKKAKLCKHCGADVDLKRRRKNRFEGLQQPAK